MKIDLFAPKNLYSMHVLAFSGWINLFIYNLFLPLNKNNCVTGVDFILLILLGTTLFFINISVLIYIFEWFVHSKVKNAFLLKNEIYDYFFDLGLVFTLIPIVWFFTLCKTKILPFLILLMLLLTIRTLKYLQRKSENNKKANGAETAPPPEI